MVNIYNLKMIFTSITQTILVSGVIPFLINRTPHTEEYIVKTYPSDFLFHLDTTNLPMEEYISTRDPSDFQEIQSNFQPLEFLLAYFI